MDNFDYDYEPIKALDPMAVMPSAAGLDIEVYEETHKGAEVPCAQPQVYLRVDDLSKILYEGVPLVHKGGFKLVNKNAFAKRGERLAVSYGVVAHNVARIAQQNGQWEFVQSPCSVYGLGIKGNAGAKHTAFTPGGDPVGAPTFSPDNCVLSLLEDVDGVVAYNRYWVRPPYSQGCAVKDAQGKSKDTRTPMSLKFWPGVVTDVPESVKDKWVEFRTRLAAKCAEVLGTAQASHPFEILIVGYSNQVDQIHKEGYEQGVLGITMNAWMIYIRPVHKNMEQKTNFAPFVSACERKADGSAFAARVKAEYLKAQTTATKATVVNNPPVATVVNTQAPVNKASKAKKNVEILSFEKIQQELEQTDWHKLRDVQKVLICISLCKAEGAKLTELLKSIYPNRIFGQKAFNAAGLDITFVLSHVVANLANLKGEITKHLSLEKNYSACQVGAKLGADKGQEYKFHLANWAAQEAGQPVAPATTVVTPVTPSVSSDEAAAHVQQQQREEAATPTTKKQDKPNGFSVIMDAVAKPVAPEEATPVAPEEATPPATPAAEETSWEDPFGAGSAPSNAPVVTTGDKPAAAEPTNLGEANKVNVLTFRKSPTETSTETPVETPAETPAETPVASNVKSKAKSPLLRNMQVFIKKNKPSDSEDN
jgi:hypothetical protein